MSRLRLLLFLRRFLGKLIAKLHFNCRRKICFRVVRAAWGWCFDYVTKKYGASDFEALGNLYQSVDSSSRFLILSFASFKALTQVQGCDFDQILKKFEALTHNYPLSLKHRDESA